MLVEFCSDEKDVIFVRSHLLQATIGFCTGSPSMFEFLQIFILRRDKVHATAFIFCH
jgi:hypothetical protein